LTQDNTSISSRLTLIQSAHRSQESQLVETLAKVQTLQGGLSQQAASFRAESETQKRLAELMDRRNEDSRRRVEEIEREWDTVLSKASATEAQLKDELTKERQRSDDLETRLDQLRVASAAEMSTPGRFGTPGPSIPSTSGFLLSPTASLATKLQKSGRSYTEVYADYVKMGDELTKQKEETRRLESALAQILSDIEERVRMFPSAHGGLLDLIYVTNCIAGAPHSKPTGRVHACKRGDFSLGFPARPSGCWT
jgi:nucleoprotein TPR